MSDDVHYKGELKLYPMKSSLEETAREIIEKEGWEYDKAFCDSYEEFLEDKGYKRYVVVDGYIYVVVNLKDVYDYDVFNAHNNNNGGTINFEVKYYDGGCSFDEAIKIAISGMEK